MLTWHTRPYLRVRARLNIMQAAREIAVPCAYEMISSRSRFRSSRSA
jgi:hypothetical protein